MGLESFDIVHSCRLSPEQFSELLQDTQYKVHTLPREEQWHYWEISGTDYVVESELHASPEGEARLSLRCAACCPERTVEVMHDIAAKVSSHDEVSCWTMFHGKIDVNIHDPQAQSIMLQQFRRRRDHLFAVYCVDNVAPAVKRTAECLDYVRSRQA